MMIPEFERQNSRVANERRDHVEAEARMPVKHLIPGECPGPEDSHRFAEQGSGSLRRLVIRESRLADVLPGQVDEVRYPSGLPPQFVRLKILERNAVLPAVIDVANDSLPESRKELDGLFSSVSAVERRKRKRVIVTGGEQRRIVSEKSVSRQHQPESGSAFAGAAASCDHDCRIPPGNHCTVERLQVIEREHETLHDRFHDEAEQSAWRHIEKP